VSECVYGVCMGCGASFLTGSLTNSRTHTLKLTRYSYAELLETCVALFSTHARTHILSLSLSLSHTHTHTHTHSYAQLLEKCDASFISKVERDCGYQLLLLKRVVHIDNFR
jgi:hypothetical protein